MQLLVFCGSFSRVWVGLQFVIMVFPDHTHLFIVLIYCASMEAIGQYTPTVYNK